MRLYHTWSSNINSFYCVVIVMVMGEAGNPEVIWTVQVVAPTEIHMMVTVRYDSISVTTKDNCGCGTKRSCTNNQTNHSIHSRNLHKKLQFFPLPRGNNIVGSLLIFFFSFTFAASLTCNPSCIFSFY